MKAFTSQNLDKTFVDSFSHGRTFVDESSIKLNQTRAGANLVPRIFCREDSANAYDYHRVADKAMHKCNNLIRSIAQRCAAQSAFTTGFYLLARSLQTIAAGGRVSRDYAGDVCA